MRCTLPTKTHEKTDTGEKRGSTTTQIQDIEQKETAANNTAAGRQKGRVKEAASCY